MSHPVKEQDGFVVNQQQQRHGARPPKIRAGKMDEPRTSTTADLIVGFARGSENPPRLATEMIDVLSDDPRWAPDDIEAVRSGVEQRLTVGTSGMSPGGILLVQ